jgi:hypothetical protein
MRKTLVIVVPLAFAILGIVLLATYTTAIQSTNRTSLWTQAAANIEKVTGTESGEIAVRYEHDGRAYRAEHLSFHARTDPYRTGQPVIVYVNPANPAEAVVEAARRLSPWQPIGGGFALLIAGILALFFRRQSAVRTRRKPVRRSGGPPMSRLRPPAPIKRTEPGSQRTPE